MICPAAVLGARPHTANFDHLTGEPPWLQQLFRKRMIFRGIYDVVTLNSACGPIRQGVDQAWDLMNGVESGA